MRFSSRVLCTEAQKFRRTYLIFFVSICTDALLAFAPLDVGHVKRCNKAEADFWKKNEGYQIRPSDELLQFDCGGQVSASEPVPLPV